MKWWSGDLPRPGQPPGNETWGGSLGRDSRRGPSGSCTCTPKGKRTGGLPGGALPGRRAPRRPSSQNAGPFTPCVHALAILPGSARASPTGSHRRSPPRPPWGHAQGQASSPGGPGASRLCGPVPGTGRGPEGGRPTQERPHGRGLRPGAHALPPASSVSCLRPATCRTPSWSAATRPRVSWREPPCVVSRNCEGLGRGQRFVL